MMASGSGRPSSDSDANGHDHAATPLYRYSYNLYDPSYEFAEVDGSKVVAGEPEESDADGEWEVVHQIAAETSGETGCKAAAGARTRPVEVHGRRAAGEPKTEPAPGEKEDSNAQGDWEMVPRAPPWSWVLSKDSTTGRVKVEGQCRCLRCYPRTLLEEAECDSWCLFDFPPKANK